MSDIVIGIPALSFVKRKKPRCGPLPALSAAQERVLLMLAGEQLGDNTIAIQNEDLLALAHLGLIAVQITEDGREVLDEYTRLTPAVLTTRGASS